MFKRLRISRGFSNPFQLLQEAGWVANTSPTYYRLERDGPQQRTTLGSLRKIFQTLNLKAPLTYSEKLQIFDDLLLEMRDEQIPTSAMEAEMSANTRGHCGPGDPPQP